MIRRYDTSQHWAINMFDVIKFTALRVTPLSINYSVNTAGIHVDVEDHCTAYA